MTPRRQYEDDVNTVLVGLMDNHKTLPFAMDRLMQLYDRLTAVKEPDATL